MSRSYAAVWQEPGRPVFSGRLALVDGGLELDGSASDGTLARTRLSCTDIARIRVGRSGDERIAGRPSLVLEPVSGPTLQVAPLGEAGALYEIADLLSELLSRPEVERRRATVVVPLKPGPLEAVRELVRLGPPLDAATTGLERHEVFLTDAVAVFVFEGADVANLAAGLVRSAAAWRAAAAWKDCLAGRPEVAEEAYSWTRWRSLGPR